MASHYKVDLRFLLVPLIGVITLACAHRNNAGEGGPVAKVTSVADGGAYAEVSRGTFAVGDAVILFKKECKEIPVRGGPWKNCNNFEYGSGKVERRLEDGHLFIRSDAISVPIGTQVRILENN